jgi:hypothetical protein
MGEVASRHDGAGGTVPAMPVIRPSERFIGQPYPLLDGPTPVVGWQGRPDAKGGPVFVIMSRSMLGSYKVVDRFPLTEEGWAEAWKALVKLSPAAAGKIRATLASRTAEDRALQRRFEPSPEVAELDSRSLACLYEVALLGGYATRASLTIGEYYDVRFLEDRLIVVPALQADVLIGVPYSDIEDVEIGGPGLVKSGGGFMGGGFGAVGALEGMAVAAVLNALTTQISIKTVVRIQASDCELFLLHTRATPEQLRINLSRPLAAIRAARAPSLPAEHKDREPARPSSPVEELTKLASMLDSGLLNREEFDRLKAKLLADS